MRQSGLFFAWQEVEIASTGSGKLIIFEGGDGCGKTTQVERLHEGLRKSGLNSLPIREPGSTPLGERVRHLLITPPAPGEPEITPEAEMLLYMASRAQLYTTVIASALDEGRVILLDRSYFSTFAYQGFGLGLDVEMILRLGAYVSSGIEPDGVVLLDLPVEQSLGRLKGDRDRIEGRARTFHEKVRQGYLDLARRFPSLLRVVDAAGTVTEVEDRIHAALSDIL